MDIRERLAETLASSGVLALLEDAPAEASARPVCADEHRTHARRLRLGVKGARIVCGVAAARVEPVTPAPTAAGDGLAVVLEHEVGAVGEQQRIDLRDVADGAGRLPLVVAARKQGGSGLLHQRGHR